VIQPFLPSSARALLAQCQAPVHGFVAVGLHKCCRRLGVGSVHADAALVARLDAVNEGHGFYVQHFGIKHEHAGAQVGLVHQVRHHHVFGAEAGGLGQRRIFDGA
jgi:hypothetical protein